MQSPIRPKTFATLVFALAAGGCVAAEDEVETLEQELGGHCHQCHPNNRRVKIAWLASDPANTYDAAILDGVRDVAREQRAHVSDFYSFFDPALQLQQCLDIVRRGRHDALIVIPADSNAIIPCVEAARRKDIPVVAVDLPIGPAIDTTEPQVPGQVGAVLVPPSVWGEELTPLVLESCGSRSPCEVAYIAGAFAVSNDQVALEHLDAAAAADPDLQIVAREEAFYDQGLAFALTEAILAEHPGIDVIIGAGDQMARGAEEAIAAAGATDLRLIVGAGSGAYGVEAVRDGRWHATFIALPYDEGVLGAELAIRAARCRPIAEPGINPVERRGWPAFFTTENMDELADFVAQWPG